MNMNGLGKHMRKTKRVHFTSSACLCSMSHSSASDIGAQSCTTVPCSRPQLLQDVLASLLMHLLMFHLSVTPGADDTVCVQLGRCTSLAKKAEA